MREINGVLDRTRLLPLSDLGLIAVIEGCGLFIAPLFKRLTSYVFFGH